MIKGLIDKDHKVLVGIEHFSHLEQPDMDAYFKGELSEKDLIKTVKLNNFEDYKEQLWLPVRNGGWSFGLNAPRWLTGKINAVGYDLLSDIEKQVLPENFSIGSDAYKKRILDLFGGGGHGGEGFPGFDKFFQAQSAWDDTSADQLIKNHTENPEAVIVVLFGDFHVSHGGGLPDRLSARGFDDYITISQSCGDNLGDKELIELLGFNSDPAYGYRADFVRAVKCQ